MQIYILFTLRSKLISNKDFNAFAKPNWPVRALWFLAVCPSVCPSVHLSVTRNILKTSKLILMKIGTWSVGQGHEAINFGGQEVKA